MPKLLLSLAVMIFLCQLGFSQNSSVSGSVTDTVNQKKLSNAVISILNRKDSTLIQFTRADKNGDFTIQGLDTGEVIIAISYPKFADYVDNIILQPNQSLSLGSINLTNKSLLLNEIIIRQNNAMRMKGDTLEYTADSFKVRANANAEELLKVMPGIQVDKNGKIVAQGQEVQKVLVDGEEFFSDDPTVATRNIRADAIDKVQVYDKKSDQAAFTGIDDGEKTKTINLKLKEDKKNGYFGKIAAGGGLKDKFNNEAMVNFFKGKRKISAFGTMSNTGSNGLNWQDSRKYTGGDDNFEYDENSGFFYSWGSGDNFDFNGSGLPKVWTAGAHFSNKWNENKYNFNSNYLFKKMNVLGETFKRTQSILPDTMYFNNQRSKSFSERLRHNLSGKYEWQLDSLSSLKVTFSGYTGRSQIANQYSAESFIEDSALVNTSNRRTGSDADESAFNTSILWRKKFKKAGRTISVRSEQKYNNTNSEGILDAVIDFYDPSGSVYQKDTTNQRKYNHSQFFTLNAKATYTEPITKDNFIEINYGYSNTSSRANRRTFDYLNGKYDQLNPTLTNEYDFLINIHAGGLAYRITKKKYNVSFGSDVVNQGYKQTDKLQNTSLTYNRVNLFPKANLTYRFKPQTMINFGYNGSTQQPSIQQIQPVPENEDPLNIFIGNPNIKPAFNHSFNTYFNDFKMLKERSIWGQIGLNLTENTISTSNTIGDGAKRIIESVNVGTTFNYWSYLGYSFKVPSIKTRFHVGANSSGGRFINIVDTVRNLTNNNSYSVNTSAYYSIENKLGINLRGTANYNTSKSSTRKDVPTRYWLYTGNIDFYVALPGKLDLSTDADFNFRQKTSVFDQNVNAIIWNASLSKRLFKETCSLKFSINDMLNQNIGFNRNINSNFISENTYLTLRRFWLLTFTWNFTKNNATTQNP